MTKEMTKHYDKKKPTSMLSAECVDVGDFYAIFEENNWRRVQCIDFDFETGLATVFFIDEGYDEQYKPDFLHPLDKKFCSLPAQVSFNLSFLILVVFLHIVSAHVFILYRQSE